MNKEQVLATCQVLFRVPWGTERGLGHRAGPRGASNCAGEGLCLNDCCLQSFFSSCWHPWDIKRNFNVVSLVLRYSQAHTSSSSAPFSCAEHSANSGRAESASRLHKCHHLQQENTPFHWRHARPSVPAQRPCRGSSDLRVKSPLSQPGSVTSQGLTLSGFQLPPWSKEPSLQNMEGGEARIESTASDPPSHTLLRTVF